MKTKLFFTLLFLNVLMLNAQNWMLFNKNYRYNYHYNNSALVSNVLFADTFFVSAGDTIIKLNKIVAKCSGTTCPTSTIILPSNNSYYIDNMPQFLQKNVIVKPTYTRLFDTLKLNVFTNCLVGQTWKLDSINNINVTCINKLQQTNFGTSDSVKILLIGTNDTIKLSKNFGVLQWPELYNQNKYYKLTGIELAATYSATSLYGERVPNAWDFYNYNIGDEFATNYYNYWSGGSQCTTKVFSIINKSIGANQYTYTTNLNQVGFMGGNTMYGFCNSALPSTYSFFPSASLNYMNLNSKLLVENNLYPNKLIRSQANFVSNIANFTKDNLGNFYKYCGKPCNANASFSPSINIASNAPVGLTNSYTVTSTNTLSPQSVIYKAEYFGTLYKHLLVGETFGKITDSYGYGFGEDVFCLKHFKKGNTVYFGSSPLTVGLEETVKSTNAISIYPNPASNAIKISTVEPAKFKILNSTGQFIFEDKFAQNTREFEVKNLPVGIYFAQLIFDNNQIVNKKFVVER
ncbi:MAG: T9SS type A sorting domain-containing protein [Bacteroidia bacterium]